MTIKEYKDGETAGFDPVEYDFKYELKTWWESTKDNNIYSEEKRKRIESVSNKLCKTKEDNLRRFSLYKELDVVFDCDSRNGTCDLTNEIYKALWGWSFKPSENKWRNAKHGITPARLLPDELDEKLDKWNKLNLGLGCDTMNSFMRTFKKATWIYSDNNPDYCKNKFNCISENKYLQEFACLTHSIGNFTLIPHRTLFRGKNQMGFFQSRGIRAHIKDYWDISLDELKSFLTEKQFIKYTEVFFLDGIFVCGTDINKLFDRKCKNSPEPQNETELIEFLDNVNTKIKARGKIMVDILQSQS